MDDVKAIYKIHRLHEKKCILGWHHLACRHELAECNQSFRTWCESNVHRRFVSLFRFVLSVKQPLASTSKIPQYKNLSELLDTITITAASKNKKTISTFNHRCSVIHVIDLKSVMNKYVIPHSSHCSFLFNVCHETLLLSIGSAILVT